MVMDNDEVPSAPSTPATPATPGTPGASLFGGFKHHDRNGNGKKSLLSSFKCFSVEDLAMEQGTLPKVSCSLALPRPPAVSLARKVLIKSIQNLTLF